MVNDGLPDVSGKWVTHRGAFSQSAQHFSQMRGKLLASGGRISDELAHLEPLYNFSSLMNSQETTHGVERFWNLGNVAYAAEFYLFDDSSEVGPAAVALATGGKQRVRAARRQAVVALRAKWHSTTGQYYSSYGSDRRGVDFAGWVELYDPEQFVTRKIDINDIWKYAETLNRRIHDAYQGWADAEQAKPRDQWHGFLPYPTYRAKVMYSAHQLRERRLPLETIFAVHCRLDDFAVASSALGELPAELRVEEFNWRRLALLYS